MQKIRYVLLIGSIGLLIIQLYVADYTAFWNWNTVKNILVPILLIGSLSASIYLTDKTK